MPKTDQTAILIFSRTARQESMVKRLVANRAGNNQLTQELIRHTLATCSGTSIPLRTCYSTKQSGHSFGERLGNAIEAVFAEGFSNVIVVGNDSPGLTAAHLLKAKEQVESGILSLGPSNDGGTYLIGLRQQDYQRSQFLSLAWEQPQLQASFKAYANSVGATVAWLQRLHDIDSAKDLRIALLEINPAYLIYALISAFSALQSYVRVSRTLAVPVFWNSPSLAFRGPPC